MFARELGSSERGFKGREAPTIIFGVLVGCTLALNNMKLNENMAAILSEIRMRAKERIV